MRSKQQVYKFMASKSLCVVSTVNSNGLPEGAVVGFGQTEDLQIVFGTSVESRKAINIAHNARVAAVVWDGPITVQYEGSARQLEGAEADTYAEIYFQKTPAARRHKDNPTERYFLIEPDWVRVTDLSVSPWDVTAIDL